MLVLVHGWTGDENSMWVFAGNLPRSYWIIAPRAPYATLPSGYSWQQAGEGAHERPTFGQLRPAAGSLLALVGAYAAQNYLDASQFDAIGFSQGAALVVAAAMGSPERIGRVGVLAGFVPEGAEAIAATKPLKDKPFFVAHGTLDERVSVNVARRSVELLEEAGAQVTYCEDEVGHKLSAKCLRALHAFFA